MVNTDIKIPKQHYVTFQKRQNDPIPMAFLVPYGTDKAAKRRMSTADKWANGYGSKTPQIVGRTIINEPMAGFIIKTNIQRYSTSNVVWRIEDPRGFELEISSGNLADLLQICIIENGEILTPCVWARLRSTNVLLPESSKEYQAAVRNTERVNKKVSLRDISIGNKVLLHSGEEAIYMGSYHLISLEDQGMDNFDHYKNRKNSEKKVVVNPKKKHYFYIDKNSVKYRSGPCFKGVSSAKISEILDDSITFSIAQAEKLINEKISNLDAAISDGRGNSEFYARGVIANNIEIEELKLVPVDDIEQYINSKNKHALKSDIWWPGQFIVIKSDEKFYICNRSNLELSKMTEYYDTHLFQSLDISRLSDQSTIFAVQILELNLGYNYSRTVMAARPEHVHPLFDVDNSTWYCIKAILSNEKTGNTFEINI